jgi:poly(hydroxyalkanoate) depolymerase family esterase
MNVPLYPSALCVLLAGVIASTPAYSATHTGKVEGYRYVLFVPDTETSDNARPLVVVLHGCRQSAAEIRTLTRFDALAARFGFAVLYPGARASAGNPLGCWQWWAPENQTRSGDEPGIILAMIEKANEIAAIDRQRVYALGLSSGGAMSAILGALYPETFAAVGVHSGMPYAGASTAACALQALSEGGVEPESRATIAYHGQGTRHRVMPIMVVHGSDDRVAAPINGGLIIAQFAKLNDLADDGDGDNQSIDAVADATFDNRVPEGRSYALRGFHDARGKTVMRELVVDGMGHAWSGGPPGANFSDPQGPDASSLFWQFLSRWSLSTPPVTTRAVADCGERFGANFFHYWWHGRMGGDEYWCDPWRWTWRRGYESVWAAGRCP